MYFDTWDITDFRDGYALPQGHPKNKGAIGSLWNDTQGFGATYHDLLYRAKGLLMILSEKGWYGEKTADQTTENYMRRVATLGAASPLANPFHHVPSVGDTLVSYDFSKGLADGANTLSVSASDVNGARVTDAFGVRYADPSVNRLGDVYECDDASKFINGGGTLSISTEEAVSGGSSLMATVGSPIISLNKIHVPFYERGRTMRYSFRIKTTDTSCRNFQAVREYWQKSNGAFYGDYMNAFTLENNTDWQDITVDFNDNASDSDFGYFGIYLRCSDITVPTTFYIDCLEMTRIGEETPEKFDDSELDSDDLFD